MVRSARPAVPRFFFWLLPLSFLLQIASIGIAHQYRMRAGDDHFGFGFEMGRIGRSIAEGHGFSSPYEGNTGPSAWEPPIYPYLIGGVFKLFGIYTVTSAWVLLSINSLLATLTTIPIFFIARSTFGGRVATWSAYVWAFCPYVWYWSIHWIWDTTLTPLILACVFWLALELENPSLLERRSEASHSDTGKWISFGALYGVGALANPTMLMFLPFCGLWVWRQRYRRGWPSLAGVVLSSLTFFAVLSPWLIRNYEVFRHFVFIRNDFGLQFRLGNGPSADGMLMPYFQPNLNKLELEKFQHLGELGYAAECKRFAFDWVRQHPGRFAVISLKRFFYFWNGVPRPTNSTSVFDFRSSAFLATSVLAIWGAVLAVRRKKPAAWLYAGLLLTYPTVYYFVFPHARYRHPMEPELLILIVFLLSEVQWRKPATSHER
ncbi:MAG TPA: glycosyltransferase family 39 protein [Verrucomicrobiae bacterium]|jgi:4-amino-4-deoxy-L-arabinose transferase-like glycosyltransferase|nr:glycosyltransferase family 39 protein [Verrucomicrobiae bacterium]